MAKNLSFVLGEAQYEAAPVKIERKKLYGWSELVALDDGGEECSLVSLDETGSFIIPKGGAGLGILSPDGQWVDRSSLKAVTADGQDAPLFPSSYDAPVALDKKVSAERFLEHTVKAFYQLEGPPEFAAAIGKDIFTFPFHARADYEGIDAFLLAEGGAVFMLLAYDASFDFIGLEQAENIEEADSEAVGEEEGDIDFSMF